MGDQEQNHHEKWGMHRQAYGLGLIRPCFQQKAPVASVVK